jgi:hypothetical protein
MDRRWRPQGSGQGSHSGQQAKTPKTPGKSTLSEALESAGQGRPTPAGVGVGASGLPRLNLYSSGAGRAVGEGGPAGGIQAVVEQRSKSGGPAAEAPTVPTSEAPAAAPANSAQAVPAGPPGAASAEIARPPGVPAEQAPGAPAAQGPAATGQGKPSPPPSPPTITHRTKDHAQGGAADTRTTVAVGEKVTFDSTAAGDWTADLVKAGKPAAAHGTKYEWFAPSTAGSAKITFDPGGGAAKIDTTITIVAPAVEYRNARAVAFPGQAPGVSGVSMETDVFYTPDTVSFANTMWWEEPGPASGATGYFAGKGLPFHPPNAVDLQIDATNSGIFDTAGFWNFPAPWAVGFFEWVIPTHYKVTSDDGRHLITNVHQTCNMAADGSLTVAKGGSAPITRAP